MAKVMAVFDNVNQAQNAISFLRQAGFDREISLVTKEEHYDQGNNGEAQNPVGNGVTTGGVLGGLTGLAVGAGALVIPGLGPLIAAGPLAGLISGAATGGIAGGLIDWGIPEEEGRKYEEDVRQGKTLVSVQTTEDKVPQAVNILKDSGAAEVKKH
ncbi:DUF1269 domain-containing protein [Calderihabitans maritimus]|uniref:General stress protein 17M-like domain-containing protein n=1 Tax=Calderihabitans maritimus TaxID=1246530 RepID=A0A1Z5HUG4_9FIRM|nr:DUF1269 domain-containing protein [Calderihabitans maritimus]GAW92987.1 hypothetical protein Tph_c09700 [Calderihabitans maritimus]